MSNREEITDFLSSISIDAGPEQPQLFVDHEKAFEEMVSRVAIFTTPSCIITGWKITRTLPMITARRVIGVNAWQDLAIAMRDLVGGRSATAEAALETLENELLWELRRKAATLGSYAILGTQIQFGEISGSKSQMFYATAQGTPAVLERLN